MIGRWTGMGRTANDWEVLSLWTDRQMILSRSQKHDSQQERERETRDRWKYRSLNRLIKGRHNRFLLWSIHSYHHYWALWSIKARQANWRRDTSQLERLYSCITNPLAPRGTRTWCHCSSPVENWPHASSDRIYNRAIKRRGSETGVAALPFCKLRDKWVKICFGLHQPFIQRSSTRQLQQSRHLNYVDHSKTTLYVVM